MKASAVSTFLLSTIGFIGLSAGLATPSHAVLVNCPASFTADGTAKVTHGAALSAASACQYVDPPDSSNVANATNVNAAGFFGITTWSTVVSQFDPPNDLAGTWSIPMPNFAALDYMITFKDGSGTNLISFLFNEEASSGNWTTPFIDPPFDLPGGSTTHEVSHFSIFSTPGGTTPVPEPATLALLGAGLLGLGLIRRRTRA